MGLAQQWLLLLTKDPLKERCFTMARVDRPKMKYCVNLPAKPLRILVLCFSCPRSFNPENPRKKKVTCNSKTVGNYEFKL